MSYHVIFVVTFTSPLRRLDVIKHKNMNESEAMNSFECQIFQFIEIKIMIRYYYIIVRLKRNIYV